jgi:RNA polymerase sigma-70 factor (ECF subfamily)
MDEWALRAADDWVLRAARGDAAAFGLLVRRHQSQVRGFLLRVTGGRHALADDLAQETFLEAWSKIAQFRGEGPFAGWLIGIAWSRVLMDARRKKLLPLDGVEEPSADPSHGHMAKLDLEKAFRHLHPPERAALTACHALGFSHDEAARILKMPLGTLKSHIARGREKLHGLLQGWEKVP